MRRGRLDDALIVGRLGEVADMAHDRLTLLRRRVEGCHI